MRWRIFKEHVVRQNAAILDTWRQIPRIDRVSGDMHIAFARYVLRFSMRTTAWQCERDINLRGRTIEVIARGGNVRTIQRREIKKKKKKKGKQKIKKRAVILRKPLCSENKQKFPGEARRKRSMKRGGLICFPQKPLVEHPLSLYQLNVTQPFAKMEPDNGTVSRRSISRAQSGQRGDPPPRRPFLPPS